MWRRPSTYHGCCIQSFRPVGKSLEIFYAEDILYKQDSFLLRPTPLSRPIILPTLVLIFYWVLYPGRLSYSADIILLAFSLSCGGESHLSSLRIWFYRYVTWALDYSDRPHPSCLQYLMRERVYLSRFTHLTLRLCYLDLKYLPITARVFDPYL